ncbi:MAG: ABC transporter permease [Clostridiales bacterium]|nr:ABC transporter permease [Clostridiales bacterium]
MFQNALRMTKSAMKLIFRNKAFFVLGILVPLISTLMINVWYTEPPKGDDRKVYEMESLDEQLAYQIDFNRFPVKVYDTLENAASDRIVQAMNNAGMFQIFRADATSCSLEELDASMKSSAMKDRIGAVVVLREDPEETELYSVGEDERFTLLSDSLGQILQNDSLSVPSPEVTFVAASGDEVDYYGTRNFAYCLAFGTLAFVFAGIMILGTVLAEKKDKVFNRIMMTKANRTSYFLSKVMLVVGLTLVQTLIMTISFVLFVKVDIGINVLQFFLCCFCLGLVFSMCALCVGLFGNSISTGTIIAFTIWSISDLISGTYFDIADASDLFKKLSLLMPQRWSLFAVTRFLQGNNTGYALLLGSTAAYLVIIFVASVLGLRLGEQE